MVLRLNVSLSLLALLGGLMFVFCNGTESKNKIKLVELPPNTQPIEVSFSDFNYWSENGIFYIIGIANNLSDEWSQIWVRAELLDSTGRRITIQGDSSLIIPLLSDGVPPRGRSSFFTGCPLNAMSGMPDSCRMSGAGALQVQPGPILVVTNIGGVRLLFHEPAPFGDSTIMVEKTWRVTGKINNPLDVPAFHPRVELLVYGTDNRLWYAQSLNPEDDDPVLMMNPKGPMNAKDKVDVGCFVHYKNLPLKLRDLMIGRVEMLAYDARHF